MALVLMQRAWQDDPKYKDVEYVVYHYPRAYFGQIHGGEKFVYYRPSRGSTASEASTYIGCGELSDWYPDSNDPTRIASWTFTRPVPFVKPVPFADGMGKMFESTFGPPERFSRPLDSSHR